MRKFKVKNRPKRKYVKKQTAPINLSVSKSALISIFPLFFVTLATFFFVSVLMRSGVQAGPIVSQTINQNLPHYIMPHVAPPVLPKISMTLPAISLPTIDNRPISDLVTKSGISFLGVLKDTFFRVSTFLDPRPFFSLMKQTALYTAQKISVFSLSVGKAVIATGITLTKTLARITMVVLQTIFNEIILSYRIGLQTFELFVTSVSRVGQTITNALILSIQTISKIAFQIGQAIIHEAQKFGASVQRETNKGIDVMKTPFSIAAYYLEQARPTFNKIGAILKRSAIELENNTVTIFTLPTKTMK